MHREGGRDEGEGDEALLLSVSVGQKRLCHCHKYPATHPSTSAYTPPYIQIMLRQNPYLGGIQYENGPFSEAFQLEGERKKCDKATF